MKMHISYFITYHHPHADASVSDDDVAVVKTLLRETPRLRRAHLHTPAVAKDFYTDDGRAPCFGLQLDFDTLADLEAVVAADGHLQRLAEARLPSLQGARVEQQAMVSRPFTTPAPRIEVPNGHKACAFLVHYPGPAEDFGAWINFYLLHHPTLMQRFPGIREIEIFTRIDWLDAMPWTRVHHMQRNKQIFDSPMALTVALNSPTRHEMRADYERFPPFAGGNAHFPVEADILEL